MSIKKVFVSGFSQSGKSTILKFLDNHENINVAHTHEKISVVMQGLKELFLKNKEIIDKKVSLIENYLKNFTEIKYVYDKSKIKISPDLLRNLVHKYSSYSILENHAYTKAIYDESGTTNFEAEPFNFDFYHFDKLWTKKIFSKKSITPEEFLDIYYINYFKSWKGYKKVNLRKDIFIYPESNLAFDLFDFYIKEKFNFKCIFVYRDLHDLIISKSLRTIQYGNCSNIDKIAISSLCFGDYKKKYYNYLKKIKFYQDSYPELFFTIKLDDFLENIEISQKKICNFIKLKFSKKILYPTVGGYPVSKKYFKIGDKIIDMKVFNLFLKDFCKSNFLKVFKVKYAKYLIYVVYCRAKYFLRKF